jgi:hypothetical protein
MTSKESFEGFLFFPICIKVEQTFSNWRFHSKLSIFIRGKLSLCGQALCAACTAMDPPSTTNWMGSRKNWILAFVDIFV